MTTTDIRSNQDLADLITDTVPGVTAEVVCTGGDCYTLEVRRTGRESTPFALSIGDGDSSLLLTDDGDFRYGLHVQEQDDREGGWWRTLLSWNAPRGMASRADAARAVVATVAAWQAGTTVEALAAKVLALIAEDMANPPEIHRNRYDMAMCRSFEDLHDYVDANEYLSQAGVPLGDGPDADANLALTNAVTAIVNAALAARP